MNSTVKECLVALAFIALCGLAPIIADWLVT